MATSTTGEALTTDQHSPGPWKLNRTYAGGGCLEDYPELQYVNIASHNYMQVAPNGLSLTGYVRPADARLIAAAPELLQALKDLLGRSEAEGWAYSAEERETAHNVIAKAEGRL